MKRLFLTAVFALIGLSAYCGAAFEMELVNEQNIALDGIHNISISYEQDSVSILRGNTSSLVIKEYMSKDDVSYYANISNTGDTINIVGGKRPLVSFGDFISKAEIYVPESYTENIKIKTDNGRIVIESIDGNINAETSNARIDIKNIDGTIDAKTSNGSIVIESINGNINAETSNARIDIKNIDGTVNARTSNGHIQIDSVSGNADAKASNARIDIKNIDGTVNARTSNGHIQIDSVNGNIKAETLNAKITCSTAEVLGDITLTTNNGSIDLDIPRGLFFQFSARTINGHVRTSFDDNLSRPVNDDHLYYGIVGPENNPNIKIDLETSNGSISVDWIN